MKETIPKHNDVNGETYRPRNELSPTRTCDHLEWWEKAAKGTDLMQLVFLEQFLQAWPRDKTVTVQEKRPKSVKEGSKIADDYEIAYKVEGEEMGLKKYRIHQNP